MIDVSAYYEHRPESREKLSTLKKAFQSSGPIGCTCSVCADNNAAKSNYDPASALFVNYDDILPETVKRLTPHQYFVSGQSIPAYVFKTRDWRK